MGDPQHCGRVVQGSWRWALRGTGSPQASNPDLETTVRTNPARQNVSAWENVTSRDRSQPCMLGDMVPKQQAVLHAH